MRELTKEELKQVSGGAQTPPTKGGNFDPQKHGSPGDPWAGKSGPGKN
jgi:bacteriocin-like protein